MRDVGIGCRPWWHAELRKRMSASMRWGGFGRDFFDFSSILLKIGVAFYAYM
jgi:hypothetical protein